MSVYTSSEVSKHNSRKSCWIVIKNDVYDVTSYLASHPGGEDPLLDAGGQDGTTAFEDVGHSSDARQIMKKYKIGSLAPGESCSRLRPRKWMSSSKYHRSCTETDVQSVLSKTSQSQVSLKTPISDTPPNVRASPRTPVIIVPRARRTRKRRPPPSGSKLKWALLALAVAIVAGVAYKKYAS